MRRLTWVFIFALITQLGYGIVPVLSQEDKAALEIKTVVESFLTSFAQRDLNSMMNEVSMSYSDKDNNGNIIDYAKFKSILENRINNFQKKYVDYSITDIKTVKSDIKDNQATIWTVNNWKGFNLDTSKEESGKQRRRFSLTKENGSWKITRIKWIRRKPQQQNP